MRVALYIVAMVAAMVGSLGLGIGAIMGLVYLLRFAFPEHVFIPTGPSPCGPGVPGCDTVSFAEQWRVWALMISTVIFAIPFAVAWTNMRQKRSESRSRWRPK